MSIFRNAAREILYRSFLRALKRVLLIFSPYLLLSLLGVVVILSVFGAVPAEGEDPGRAEVKRYVEGMEVETRSKYGQEEEFRLPWGIVYAVEVYAGEWRQEPDMERVARIYKGLRPEFRYRNYVEKKVVTTIYYSREGSTVHTERHEEKVELLVEADTYEGKYLFGYEEVTDTDRKVFRDDEGRVRKVVITEHTYMEPHGRRFIQDYSRLDRVIAAEIGSLPACVPDGGHASGSRFIWPVPSGRIITSPFGMRYHPVSGEYRMHTGMDIAAETGNDVVAAADGAVVFSGWREGYGNTVILDHGDGYRTLYGHNSKLTVKKGEEVTCGQKIAEAGNTGVSTGPHLHFEVMINGEHVNPLRFLQLPGGVAVSGGDNPDRRMVLETAWAFMRGTANLEWLAK